MAQTKEERAAYLREWQRRSHAANPEKRNGASRKRYARNEAFRKRSADSHREWSQNNAERLLEYQRRWREENPEKYRQIWRAAALRKYGLTIAQYDAMLAAQNSACMICRLAFDDTPKSIHVDHCHGTGRVRGLLCSGCNTGIGCLQDSPEILRRASEYLRRAKK